mgnify:CR=1 FL=1
MFGSPMFAAELEHKSYIEVNFSNKMAKLQKPGINFIKPFCHENHAKTGEKFGRFYKDIFLSNFGEMQHKICMLYKIG